MRPSELDLERWHQVDELFDAALETPPAERVAFLAAACAHDDELRVEVEALLDAHERAGTRFDDPVSPIGAALLAASEASRENRNVGPFRLVREIGRGGMGVVYLAEDTRLGRQVALKALPPYLGVGAEAKQRFVSEAKAVSALDHPHIATLYEIGESPEGQLYMAFAFYEGETLADRIARGPLPVKEAVQIAIGIAAGLEAAHDNGIIHRDVKPSNVLLTDGGEVKLLDFGVAKVAGEDVTREGERLGTVAYMSPEQASGGSVDRRTDLWSLGVVLLEMLTGERPFRGADHASLVRSILQDQQKPPSTQRRELPDSVDRVVEKLLCKTAHGRYRSAGDLLLDLGALGVGASPSVAIREPPPRSFGSVGRFGSPVRRRNWRPLPAALLGLVMVSTGVWAASDAAGPPGRRIERLAVMPLTNLTGDPEQQYFVDGVQEALIAELGRLGALHVLSRTSVMRYRDSDEPVSEIASELGVDAVVEGSVYREADNLAITAQLIATSPERLLWANRYRGSVEELFDLSGEVARSIATEIDLGPSRGELVRPSTSRRVNPRAYDSYLRGWVYWARRNRDGFDLARSYFRRAIEIDPSFAPAYAGLAETYSGAAVWGLKEPSPIFSEARDLAAKALRIDSTLPEAYVAMAAVEYYAWDWAETERLARRALDLNPSNVRALRQLGHALSAMGRRREARAVHDRANELDTVLPEMGMAFSSYARREFDRAIVHARSGQEFDEGLWQAPWLICMSLVEKGLHDRAIDECERVAAHFGRTNPVILAGLGYAYARGERRDEAKQVVEELETLGDEVYVSPSLIAIVYGALGDWDRAFERLDHAYEKRDVFLLKLHLPFFDSLRSHPRFEALIKKIGLGK